MTFFSNSEWFVHMNENGRIAVIMLCHLCLAPLSIITLKMATKNRKNSFLISIKNIYTISMHVICTCLLLISTTRIILSRSQTIFILHMKCSKYGSTFFFMVKCKQFSVQQRNSSCVVWFSLWTLWNCHFLFTWVVKFCQQQQIHKQKYLGSLKKGKKLNEHICVYKIARSLVLRIVVVHFFICVKRMFPPLKNSEYLLCYRSTKKKKHENPYIWRIDGIV